MTICVRRFSCGARHAWYVDKKGEIDAGKKFFLERVGFEIREVDLYDEIYGPSTWDYY
jgi:hypothetical protein